MNYFYFIKGTEFYKQGNILYKVFRINPLATDKFHERNKIAKLEKVNEL